MKISENSCCYIYLSNLALALPDIGRPRNGIVEINLDFGIGRRTYHQKASIIFENAKVCAGVRRRGDGDGRREMEAAIRFLALSSRM